LISALTSLSDSTARRIFFKEGGSKASSSVCSTSPRLQIFTRNTRSCKESLRISGVCSSASYAYLSIQLRASSVPRRTCFSYRCLVNKWKQIPFRTRPALPRRCFAFAREINDSTSLESRRLSSKLVASLAQARKLPNRMDDKPHYFLFP